MIKPREARAVTEHTGGLYCRVGGLGSASPHRMTTIRCWVVGDGLCISRNRAAPMARPPNADADATRRRILQSAITLFSDRGIGETSVRDVVAASGVSLAM